MVAHAQLVTVTSFTYLATVYTDKTLTLSVWFRLQQRSAVSGSASGVNVQLQRRWPDWTYCSPFRISVNISSSWSVHTTYEGPCRLTEVGAVVYWFYSSVISDVSQRWFSMYVQEADWTHDRIKAELRSRSSRVCKDPGRWAVMVPVTVKYNECRVDDIELECLDVRFATDLLVALLRVFSDFYIR